MRVISVLIVLALASAAPGARAQGPSLALAVAPAADHVPEVDSARFEATEGGPPRRHTIVGALIGAAVGVAAGYATYDVFCDAVDNQCADSRLRPMVIGGLIGALLGGVIGAVLH